MPDQQSGGPSREDSSALSVDEVLVRVQELADAEPTDAGLPLEWAVPAYFLGDLSALATLSLRSEGPVLE